MIARTLMSLPSWATSGLSVEPCGCDDISVPPMVLLREHLLEERIVDRQQRHPAQLSGEQEDPRAGERQRDPDVRKADRERALVESGGDEPDDVVEPGGDDEPGDARQQIRP